MKNKKTLWAKAPIRMLEIKLEREALLKELEKRLICDFDIHAHLEIWVHYWMKAVPKTFRSWPGPRRINGSDYTGPVYFYLSNDKAGKPTQSKKSLDRIK